jgi:hypothetical protein
MGVNVKTAKEVCEEVKSNSLKRVIDVIIENNGQIGHHWYYKHLNRDIETNMDKLLELGYKVEKKYYITSYTEGIWFWKKHINIRNEYYQITACCGEEK